LFRLSFSLGYSIIAGRCVVLGRENKPHVFSLSRPTGFHIIPRQQTSHVFRHQMCLIPSSCLSWWWNVNHAPKPGLCPNGKIQLDCPCSTFSKYKSLYPITLLPLYAPARCGLQAFSYSACVLVSGSLCRLHRTVHIIHHFVGIVVMPFCQYYIHYSYELATQSNY